MALNRSMREVFRPSRWRAKAHLGRARAEGHLRGDLRPLGRLVSGNFLRFRLGNFNFRLISKIGFSKSEILGNFLRSEQERGFSEPRSRFEIFNLGEIERASRGVGFSGLRSDFLSRVGEIFAILQIFAPRARD